MGAVRASQGHGRRARARSNASRERQRVVRALEPARSTRKGRSARATVVAWAVGVVKRSGVCATTHLNTQYISINKRCGLLPFKDFVLQRSALSRP